MPVEWGLDFWEYGWGGQVNYCANGTGAGTSFLWQYDSTSHSGHIKINGTTYPFTYDPSTETLSLDYSTTVYGTNITIGGNLQFLPAAATSTKRVPPVPISYTPRKEVFFGR
ncbi:MAG: hypothetical protein IJ524_00330 [Bacteroidales bacterium]|nr:hypothetical protein [Bacteroidales bacterium]